jgi:hypothetical protein
MREASLPSPNCGQRGYHLRRIAAQAISQLEVVAPNYPDGKHPAASELRNFFSFCANALAAIDATPATEDTV